MNILKSFALILFVSLAGCTSSGSMPTAPSAVPVSMSRAVASGAIWTLRNFTDSHGRPVTLPGAASFSIEIRDGRIGVQSDCNRCNGSAAVADSSLDVSLLACTRAFCSSSPVDSQFEATLQGSHAIAFVGAQLTLTSPRGTLGFTR